MNGIDAERNKIEETPEQARLRHEARGYRPGYLRMTAAEAVDAIFAAKRRGLPADAFIPADPTPAPTEKP